MTDVLVVGEALIDIVVPGGVDAHEAAEPKTEEHVGGSPANVAIGLARLGHHARLATHVGEDERGRRIVTQLTGEGIELATRSTAAPRTPTATARLDASGAATYEFDLAWELPRDPAWTQAALAGVGHVHTGSVAATLAPGADAVRDLVRAARDSCTISYDPNARPALMGSPEAVAPHVAALLAAADVIKASDEDVAWLAGATAPTPELLESTAKSWLDGGAAIVVITRGDEGALVAHSSGLRPLPTWSVDVADTVGAGDAFMSGLLSGFLDAGLLGGPTARERLHSAGWDDIRPAILRALACGAVTVSRAGANPPRRDDLLQLPTHPA